MRKRKLKKRKLKPCGAPLGPDDPGFYGNATTDVRVTATSDTMGRPMPDLGSSAKEEG